MGIKKSIGGLASVTEPGSQPDLQPTAPASRALRLLFSVHQVLTTC